MVMITAKIRALLPRVITRRDIIRAVPARWAESYPDDSRQLVRHRAGDVRLGLERLDLETATESDVADIIGNASWTQLQCDVCEQDREQVVSVPREYEGTLNVCLECAEAVAEMLSDTDESPKGGDGEAGSMRSTTAGAEGIALAAALPQTGKGS